MSVIISTPAGVAAAKNLKISGEHQEVSERHAGVEQQDARHQQRHRDALLMLVQAGGDEAPDLVQDHRDRQEQRDHHGQLQWRQERRRHVGGDHRRAGRQVMAQWRGDEGVDLLGKGEQPGKDHEDRRHATQQAGTQLGEVRDQVACAGRFPVYQRSWGSRRQCRVMGSGRPRLASALARLERSG